MILGDARLWSDVFPDGLVPQIIDLVWKTWGTFPKPAGDELEVPITRRFKQSLRQAKNLRRLPLRIERESAEDDPRTGEESGRIDLKFVPAESAREEVYFAFECKRLNVVDSGRRRTLAAEYVTQGMMRFVTRRYGGSMHDGGMIGYVMDGRPDNAIRRVAVNIESHRRGLKLRPGEPLAVSSLRPKVGLIRETTHDLSASTRFRLHHLFLACPTRTTRVDGSPPKTDGFQGS